MKKLSLLLCMLMLQILQLSAQLKVNSNGSVNVGFSSNNFYDLSIGGRGYAQNFIFEYDIENRGISYLRGDIYASSDLQACDIVPYSGDGVGKLTLASDEFVSATLKITGNGEYNKALDIDGKMYLNNQLMQSSDERLKKDIEKLEGTSILSRIESFDAKQYKFKSKKELSDNGKKLGINFPEDTVDLYANAVFLYEQKMAKSKAISKNITKEEKESLILKKYLPKAAKQLNIVEYIDSFKVVVAHIPNYDTSEVKYGFLAQDIEPVFPELVDLDSLTGLYSVDYISFIPLIFEATKELKRENDELRKELDEIKSYLGIKDKKEKSAKVVTSVGEPGIVDNKPALLQNNPNPFSESTTIKYYLPNDTKNAFIYIYDMQGKQLKDYQLYNTGNSEITITSSNLYAGMFTYALVVDGCLIESKRMILTE